MPSNLEPLTMSDLTHSFHCVLPHEPPRILILGSLPSVASVGQQQYYAHPHNAFWRIMEALFAQGLTLDYAQRLALLKQQRIALWDVIASARREGSLDSAIEPDSVVPNDIIGLLNTFPSVHSIYLNGGSASALFKRYIAKQLPRALNVITLPSTSPANARMRFEEKLAKWRVIQQNALPSSDGQ